MNALKSILLLLVVATCLWACDRLTEDVIPENATNEIINADQVFAVPGAAVVINILNNPQENATIKLSSDASKADIQWLNNNIISYKAKSGSTGKDYLIFNVKTEKKEFTDTITVVIGTASQFETDSCMPFAREDFLPLVEGVAAQIDVTTNDIYCNYTVEKLSIVSNSVKGKVLVINNRIIRFEPNSTNFEFDSVYYQAKLTNPQEPEKQKTVYSLLQVYRTEKQDTTCRVQLVGTNYETSLDSAIVINLSNRHQLCEESITNINYFTTVLGSITKTNQFEALFTPAQNGYDSVGYELTLSDGNSYSGKYTLVVSDTTGNNGNECEELAGTDDSYQLNFPTNTVKDLDVLINDTYCTNLALYLSVPDSMNLGNGLAQIVYSGSKPLIRYTADSIKWTNGNTNEYFEYLLCQGSNCESATVSISK